MTRRLVATDVAVCFLEREGVTKKQARRKIYQWSHQGVLVNHGKACAKAALWDLDEISALVKGLTEGESAD